MVCNECELVLADTDKYCPGGVIIGGKEPSVNAKVKTFLATILVILSSWIPQRIVLWCLIRGLAEYEPQFSWESREIVAYWRVLDWHVWKTMGNGTFKEWSESE